MLVAGSGREGYLPEERRERSLGGPGGRAGLSSHCPAPGGCLLSPQGQEEPMADSKGSRVI